MTFKSQFEFYASFYPIQFIVYNHTISLLGQVSDVLTISNVSPFIPSHKFVFFMSQLAASPSDMIGGFMFI